MKARMRLPIFTPSVIRRAVQDRQENSAERLGRTGLRCERGKTNFPIFMSRDILHDLFIIKTPPNADFV
jgi:hypothetical protein